MFPVHLMTSYSYLRPKTAYLLPLYKTKNNILKHLSPTVFTLYLNFDRQAVLNKFVVLFKVADFLIV